MNPGEKRLNAMNRLGDMGHFPISVHAGATVNILAMILLTWFVQPHLSQPWAPVAFTALILVCNLLPVALLRLGMNEQTTFPRLADMDFWRDQHKFSDWVYLAASANMAFWVLLAWSVFSAFHTLAALAGMLLFAFIATFSPVLLRVARR